MTTISSRIPFYAAEGFERLQLKDVPRSSPSHAVQTQKTHSRPCLPCLCTLPCNCAELWCVPKGSLFTHVLNIDMYLDCKPICKPDRKGFLQELHRIQCRKGGTWLAAMQLVSKRECRPPLH